MNCGWLGRAECLRLPTTWTSARGPQLCPELVRAILASPLASEGECQCPGPGWQLPGLGCGPLLWPFTPQPPAGVHVLQHDRRTGRQIGPRGPGGEPRPWLATWPLSSRLRPCCPQRPWRGGLGLPAAPRWLHSGEGSPGQRSRVRPPCLAASALSCSCPVATPRPAPPWPSARMAAFCSQPPSGLSGCGTAQRRLASAARCVSRAGGQEGGGWPWAPWADTARGLCLRSARHRPPRCTLATRSWCGLWPSPPTSSSSSVWETPSSSGTFWFPVRGGPQAGKCLPSLEPARPLWAPAAPKAH